MIATAASSARVGNRFRVLRALYRLGTATRQDLAAAAGLSPGTVSTIVGELLETAVVQVAAVENPGLGRPRERLRVHRDRGLLVGVDVAETYVEATGFDLGLDAVTSHRTELDEQRRAPDYVLDSVTEAVARVLTPGPAVVGIGVSIPGAVDPGTGTSVFAPNRGWRDVPVAAPLAARLPAPVVVDNPLKAITAAELWFGADGVEDLVAVNLGTGVGAGIALGGRLLRGAGNRAGEWGHTLLVLDGRRCSCGRRGCVEAYVGVHGIARTLRAIDPDHPALRRERQPDLVTGIRRALGDGDPTARLLVTRTAGYLGAALGDLVALLDPPLVTLTGWTVDLLGEWLVPATLAELPRHLPRGGVPAVQVQATALPGNPVTLGMATLTLERFLEVAGVPSRDVPPGPAPGGRARDTPQGAPAG